jgi:ABC-type nitrate/sulfonate/bicarbonate transport system permease component
VSRLAPVLIVAIVWEAAGRLGLLNPALVPLPSAIAAAFARLARSADLATDTVVSLWRGAAGLGLSVGVGTVVGMAMARVRWVERVVQPLVSVTYPLPKSALIPLLMIWLGIGDAAKIAVVFLGTVLPVIVGAYHGVRGVDHYLVWSAQSCGTAGARLVRRVMLPAALPDLLAGVRTALALSFVLLISSELLVATNGLGHLISLLGEGGQYPEMFAVALLVCALGFGADRLFLAAMRWLLRWRET